MAGGKQQRTTDAQRKRESEQVLGRVQAESETIGTSSLVRMAKKAGSHLSAGDAEGEDAAEIWGRRVGRSLSVVAFLALAIWLINWLSR